MVTSAPPNESGKTGGLLGKGGDGTDYQDMIRKDGTPIGSKPTDNDFIAYGKSCKIVLLIGGIVLEANYLHITLRQKLY